MADSRRYGLTAQLDIKQILIEAQHRWLRPAEICEILRNYREFQITPEPSDRPSSGSLFLFDRKVLRYFRKDGHNWRKKKDGKTVKEAHERLKAGSIDVLHCYYAHGEENRNFQRRSYWMLEEELSHIVFVHYREVKGNGTNFSRVGEADATPDHGHTVEEFSTSESSAASHSQPFDRQKASHVTDTTSFNSTWTSEYEDAESAYRHQASPGFQIQVLRSPLMQNTEVGSVPYYPVPISNDYSGQFSSSPGLSLGSVAQEEKDTIRVVNDSPYEFQEDIEFPSWGNVASTRISGNQSINFQSSDPFIQPSEMRMMFGHGNELGQAFNGAFGQSHELGRNSNVQEEWQDFNCDSIHISERSVDQKSDGNLNLGKTKYEPSEQPPWYDLITKVNEVDQLKLGNSTVLCNTYPTKQSGQPMHDYFEAQASNSGESSLKVEDKTYYPPLKQPLFNGIMRDGLKKMDSFDRWMSKELEDVTDLGMRSDSGTYWETVGNEDGIDGSGISNRVPLDNYILAPSLSQDQFISILEFSPNWAYSGSEVKVLVRGKFLRSREEVEKLKWACMFGELEVPSEIVDDGVLCCRTPLHDTGRVPFYVTCSNRLACSEVREFEFRSIRDEDLVDDRSITSYETLLHTRFGKLLSLGPAIPENSIQINEAETSLLCGKVNSLLKDDTEREYTFNLAKQDELSADNVKDQTLQKLLKEKFHAWLLQKVTEGGKGPSVLDEEGQGVLHFAAALGYDWAIPSTLAAGVSVNFRDVNGWTALHWAACYGRERTVALLISLGAAPGALTDPTPKYPSGRTPADLASRNGHKGISGYLAEATLSSHLVTLKLKDSKENDSTEKAVETVSERIATPVGYGDLPHGLSLKDSLAAVRNATQAAARIHQVYRAQSFQRKQLKEYGDSEFGMSDERALSLLALKTNKARQHDEPVSAAIRIQNKYRSYKGRKDFLLIRQHVIKIQAHVRGHQVRKSYYKKIIWTVGIVDKVILRWRRKRKGLSGFNADALAAGTSMQDNNETKEDDYDFLKEGRKQTEERFQKALDRVKSMVQYPEARDQYRRLLNVVSEIQETKAAHEDLLNNPDVDFDDLISLEALLGDDAFMDATF